MDKRKSVYKNGHVVTVVVCCALLFADDILVDDLEEIVVDVLFVDKRNVFCISAVVLKRLDMVFLDGRRFFLDTLILVGELRFVKTVGDFKSLTHNVELS